VSLTDLIHAQIRQSGLITVHDYMQLCLQHPDYGYYRKARAVGAEGDFITAPEISQIFGDMTGLWLIDQWQRMGSPVEWHLVELGPGRGTLSADVLRMWGEFSRQPSAVSRQPLIHLVESNATLRELQREKLGQYHPQWHDGIETLPDDAPLFILANEFFDALPIRQWVGGQERCVVLDATAAMAFAPEGDVTREDCPAATAILGKLAERMQRQGGVLWIADYGYIQSPVANHDTLQALKAHHYHDPLKDCGEVDLTAHVDFTALAEAAASAGLHVTGPLEQGAFLQSLGGDLWLQKLLRKTSDPAQRNSLQSGWLRLISPAQMGSLFKILILHPQR